MGLAAALVGAGAALITFAGAKVGVAQTALDLARTDRVVARVGSTTITAGEVERRIAKVPLFQLRMLGEDGDSVRRAFVDQLVNMELLVQGARADKLDQQKEVHDSIRSVLVSALKGKLREEAAAAGKVGDDAIKAYYDAHQERYQSQLRLQLWQIPVASKEQADKILKTIREDAEYQKDPIKGWEKLARENSIDKSTHMRGGNLGFVQPDGSTAHKDIRVPKQLFDEAAKVKDGEVVPHPVSIGRLWVVLQRRGSHHTPHRSLEQERETIRGLLSKQQVQQRLFELRDELRKKYVRETYPDRVDRIDIVGQGELAPKRRPGALMRRHPAAGDPRPRGVPGYLR